MIRPAVPDDLAAITSIYNHAVEHTTASWDLAPVSQADRADWFAARTLAGQPVVVASDDTDTVIGFASYGPFRAKAGYASTVEHSVYVTPGAAGHGVGRALMESLIAHARRAGVHVMVGGVDAANEASLRFHDCLGFTRGTPLPQVGRKFGRWLDLVFVTLVLDGDDSATPEEITHPMCG